MSTSWKPGKPLVLCASLTPWKGRLYAALLEKYGISGKDLSDYMVFHSAPETGVTANQNRGEKETSVSRTINLLRSDGQERKDFFKRIKQSGEVFEGNQCDRVKHVVFFVDDTTISMRTDLWNALLPALEKLVIPESLVTSACAPIEGEPHPHTCVTDIGRIMNTLGQETFWRLVVETADKMTDEKGAYIFRGKPIKIYNQVSFSYTHLREEGEQMWTEINAETPLYVYRAPENYQPKSKIPTSEDFLCSDERAARPVSEDFENFVLRDSTQKRIIDTFVEQINAASIANATEVTARTFDESVQKTFSGAAAQTTFNRRKIKVVLFAAEGDPSTPECLRKFDVTRIVLPSSEDLVFEDLNKDGNGKPVGLHDAISMDFPCGRPDVVFFPRFDRENDKLRAHYNLMYWSAYVEKSISTHGMKIVVQNDGCYDDIIDEHLHQAKAGFSKDFIKYPLFEHGTRPFISGAEWISTHYIDFINAKDAKKLDAATDKVLSYRLENFHRVEPRRREPSLKGKKIPKNFFFVTHFGSASSSNLNENRMAFDLGAFAAAQCMGLRTGGGNTYVMGEAIKGYNWARIPDGGFLSCASTFDIVAGETMAGRLPQSERGFLTNGVGDRLKELWSPCMVSGRGGPGTAQEMAYAYLRINYLPPLTIDGKPIDQSFVFLGKNESMMKAIKATVGKDYRSPEAMAVKGMYVVANMESAKELVMKAANKFYATVNPDWGNIRRTQRQLATSALQTYHA